MIIDIERLWDEKLNIHTIGRDDSLEDRAHYPYEPTSYVVLERLCESGYLDEGHHLLDYGCGLGRVDLYLSDQLGCATTGIDFDERMICRAQENLSNWRGRDSVGKECRAECRAQENLSSWRGRDDLIDFCIAEAGSYSVKASMDCFYFFNPFPVKVLRRVMRQILDSWYETPRKLRLFFYYPSDAYVGYLMTVDELEFVDEIDCKDLFLGQDPRERILVFETL